MVIYGKIRILVLFQGKEIMIEILGKQYLTQKEVSQKYGYSAAWFERQRYLKKPPPFIKIQGKILYELESLNRWFENQLKEKEI
jgi:hypothetical protein